MTFSRISSSGDLGARLADGIARVMGSWRFIRWQNGLIAVWGVWNALAPVWLRYDRYPYVFLNLIMSWQAANATPVLLMASNRQAELDRAQWARIEQVERQVGEIVVVLRALVEETQRAELASLAEHTWMLRELHAALLPSPVSSAEPPSRAGAMEQAKER